MPYGILSCVVILFAFALLKVRFPSQTHSPEQPRLEQRSKPGSLLRIPYFVHAVIAQLCHVGAQVGTWSFLIRNKYT